MRLNVAPISGAEHLAFIRSRSSVSFLQTPAWGRVKREWRSESLGWYQDNQRLVGAGLVLHRPLPGLTRASLAYIPQSPAINWTGELGIWLKPLVAYLKAQGAFAVRIGPPVPTHTWCAARVKEGIANPDAKRLTDLPGEPTNQVGANVARQLSDAGWLPQSPGDGFGTGQPQFTFQIPLRRENGQAKTEDDLLSGMNQLWRRNIKKAAREGVEVRLGRDLEAFHGLYVHTAERDHFTPRPLPYFETMFAELTGEDPERIKLYLGHHQGVLVAATIGVRVGGHAWYLYGASSTEKREVRGSNACQWAMIRDSLAAGCDLYDLRGITPTVDPDDPHVGLIQFKVGIGGQAVRYVGEWDLPLRPMIYQAFSRYLRRREYLRSTTQKQA